MIDLVVCKTFLESVFCFHNFEFYPIVGEKLYQLFGE